MAEIVAKAGEVRVCDHMGFEAQVDVNRLEDTQDGEAIRCMVDLHIQCAACHSPLCFALPLGLDLTQGATMSVDATEARLAASIGIPRALGLRGFTVREELL